MNDEEKFDYTYTAPTEKERREIERIKRQYEVAPVTPNGDKLEELRKLNKKANVPPLVVGWVLGIVGTLVFGSGMTMVLQWSLYLWGVIVGAVGAAIIAVAYPVYKAMLKANKKKYGGRILALSNELLNNEEKQET